MNNKKTKIMLSLIILLLIFFIGVLILLIFAKSKESSVEKNIKGYTQIKTINSVNALVPERKLKGAKELREYIYDMNEDYFASADENGEYDTSLYKKADTPDFPIYRIQNDRYVLCDGRNTIINYTDDLAIRDSMEVMKTKDGFNKAVTNCMDANMVFYGCNNIIADKVSYSIKNGVKQIVAKVTFNCYGVFSIDGTEKSGVGFYNFIDKSQNKITPLQIQMKGYIKIIEKDGVKYSLILGNNINADKIDKSELFSDNEFSNILNSFSYNGQTSSIIKNMFTGKDSVSARVLNTNLKISMNNINKLSDYEKCEKEMELEHKICSDLSYLSYIRKIGPKSEGIIYNLLDSNDFTYYGTPYNIVMLAENVEDFNSDKEAKNQFMTDEMISVVKNNGNKEIVKMEESTKEINNIKWNIVKQRYNNPGKTNNPDFGIFAYTKIDGTYIGMLVTNEEINSDFTLIDGIQDEYIEYCIEPFFKEAIKNISIEKTDEKNIDNNIYDVKGSDVGELEKLSFALQIAKIENYEEYLEFYEKRYFEHYKFNEEQQKEYKENLEIK